MPSPDPVRHPVWWYRLALVLMIGGVGTIGLRAGVLQWFFGVFIGRALQPGPEVLPTFIWLMLACAPFFGTVKWLSRVYERTRQAQHSERLAAKVIVMMALGRRPRLDDDVHAEDDEEPASALMVALSSGVMVLFALLLMRGAGAWGGGDVVFGIVVGLAAASGYCRQRAAAYARPRIILTSGRRWLPPPPRFRLDEYEPVGRPWLVAGWVLTAAWLVLMFVSISPSG